MTYLRKRDKTTGEVVDENSNESENDIAAVAVLFDLKALSLMLNKG